MLSVTYVSQAVGSVAGDPETIAREIARASAPSNHALGVTGALIFTTAHFAQVLEGPPLAIENLLLKIGKDRRHRLVQVLQRRYVARRMFPEWSMAYAGGPVSLDKFMAQALRTGQDHLESAELLTRLITQFALSRKAQGRLKGTQDLSGEEWPSRRLKPAQ